MFPDYTTQQVDRLGHGDPDAGVRRGGTDSTRRSFQPSTIAAYSAAGVQWGMPFNVSNPVLYYNRNMFEAAGLDPEPSAAVAGGAAPVLAAARRLGRRRLRAGDRVRAAVPAAGGTSSSGSPTWASSTPTTATGGWRPPREVLYDGAGRCASC